MYEGNGAGEVGYANWSTFSSPLDTTYVYQGGGTLYRFVTNLNEPVETSYAKTFDITQDPSTYTWEKVYDYTTADDRLTSQTDAISTNDPSNHTLRPAIKYTLDSNGAILRTTYHDATHDDTTYNSFREPLTYSDRLGRSTHYTYDTQGNLTQKVVAYGTADAATFSWTYNSLGQLTSLTDADSNETDYSYNATTHLLTSVTQPADVSGGRRTDTVEAYGTAIAAHTKKVYDAQGNVTEIDSPRYFDSSDTNGYNKDKVTMTYTGRNFLKDRTEAAGVTGVTIPIPRDDSS